MPKTRTSGQGRPKGSQNRDTADLREMILTALNRVGAIDYLARQAVENPATFLTLLGKILPTQVTADVTIDSYVIRAPAPVESAAEWLATYAPKQIDGEVVTEPELVKLLP